MTEKPLFLPLKTQYYAAFEIGHKSEEYRLYGKMWNEKNCRIGRRITLSNGYGKKNRLQGIIVGFRKLSLKELTLIYPSVALSLASIYQGRISMDTGIACIEIKINRGSAYPEYTAAADDIERRNTKCTKTIDLFEGIKL